MKASVKRIVWSIGWNLVWVVSDLEMWITTGHTASNFVQWVMLAVWIVPLLLFKDDKENKK